MVPTLGNLALWLSLFFACFQLYTLRKKNKPKLISISVKGLLISTIISFFLLMYLHIISDFSVINVFQNSHTTKPLFYKITAVWGNHEGSMLLWILVLTIFNYFIFKLYNENNFIFVSKTFRSSIIYIYRFLYYLRLLLLIHLKQCTLSQLMVWVSILYCKILH